MDERPMSIEALKAIQRAHDLCDVHLVDLGPERFTVTHTDEERASTMPLTDCALHLWLSDQDGPPKKLGVYMVTPHEVDAYSEAYPVAEWDFTPLNVGDDRG